MEKSLQDYIHEAKKNGMMELGLEEMDLVSGGVMTGDEKKQLIAALKMAKAAGVDLNKVLSLVPTYFKQLSPQHPNVTQSEVVSFIKNNWANL